MRDESKRTKQIFGAALVSLLGVVACQYRLSPEPLFYALARGPYAIFVKGYEFNEAGARVLYMMLALEFVGEWWRVPDRANLAVCAVKLVFGIGFWYSAKIWEDWENRRKSRRAAEQASRAA